MAQPIIIDRSARAYRAQAAAAPYLAGAQIVTGIAGSIEQLLFDAQQRKAQEHERKLALMGSMVSKYGFKELGPDFAWDWEKTTGMRFPRDPETGQPVVPQSDEERIRGAVTPRVMEAIQNDPRQAMVYAGLAKPDMTPDEKDIKNRELQIKEEGNRIREKGYALRYASALAKKQKDDMPSGWAVNPETNRLDYVGMSSPSLSNNQLSKMDKVVKFNNAALDAEHKQAQIDQIRHKMETGDNIDKSIPAVVNARNKEKDKKQRMKYDAIINTFLERHGIEVPEEAQSESGFGAWVKSWFVSPTPATKGGSVTERLKRGGAAPPTPAQTAAASPAGAKGPLVGMSDDQVRGLFKQKLEEGMNPVDIIDQSGGDIRAVQILSELTGLGANPQLGPGWRPGMAPQQGR